jgi:Holliday junction DNA helicase RuvA
MLDVEPIGLRCASPKAGSWVLDVFSPPPIVTAVITFLEGALVEALPTHVVVSVHGVGYHVFIPLSSYDRLPAVGAQIKILTHLQVREDAHVLYGFMSAAERDLFRLLVNHVSGIGPKTALDVLSGASVAAFKGAVVAGDISSLSKFKGIGKKTAERIIVELKDKVGVAAAWEAASAAHAPTPQEASVNDAVLALISLGYKQVDAHKAVKQTQEKGGAAQTSEELVRGALKLLI